MKDILINGKKVFNGKMLVEFREKFNLDLSDNDWKEKEKRRKEFRKEVEEKFEETAKYMEEARRAKFY